MHPARQIGPYTVEVEIGRGGMGVVYRGRDTRLERAVAIKTLPAAMSADEARLARFDREARLLAGLSHPNIATVYGLEQDDTGRYLVMELVEGETLAQRLGRGRLPVEDALAVAAQIAAGVEAAHERAIIHRDLKPGNVMIAPDGSVKVLDFGVAREVAPPPPGGDSAAATIPVGVTQEGIAIGTPGYMSPEQARGREVDRRTDVFALGCILFECLAGMGPFEGRTPADSVAATLEREPEWAALPERTPSRIRELLEHCLEKDLKRRLRDVGDARLELERAIERREWTTTGTMRAAPPARQSWTHLIPWGIAALVVIGAAAWLALDRRPATSPSTLHRPQVRFIANDPTPRAQQFDVASLAISDDGEHLAYSQEHRLFLRSLGEAGPGRVMDEEFSHTPVFSPDGRWLAFSRDARIFRVSVEGGQPSLVYTGEGMNKGFCWGVQGFVLTPGLSHGLVLLNPDTRVTTTLTTPNRAEGEISHRWPDALPDGRHVLFTIKRAGIETFDEADIALLDTQSGQYSVIIRGGSYARYAPSGHIIYARAGSLFAVAFDAQAGRVTSPPAVVLQGVTTEPGSGAAQFALARQAGTLIITPGGANTPGTQAVLVATDGAETPLRMPVRNYALPRVSPDGKRMAMIAFGATDSIFVHDFVRGTTTRITFDGNAAQPFWSLDGQRVCFTSDRDGTPALYRAAADGSGPVERLGTGPTLQIGSLSCVRFEAGEAVLYAASDGVWVLPENGEARRIVATPTSADSAAVSPDQRWLAYTTAESGQSEVYVRPFPTGDARWQVTARGKGPITWLPDSDGLVYRVDTTLMVARWGAEGPAGATSEASPLGDPAEWNDVLPDMSGLVVLRAIRPPPDTWRVEVILNWLDDLADRVPGGERPGG